MTLRERIQEEMKRRETPKKSFGSRLFSAIKAPFKKENLKNFITPTKKLGGFGKDVVQGTARSGASVGATVSEMYGGSNELRPESRLQKAMFGSEPVKSLTTRTIEGSKKTRSYVKEKTGKDIGIGSLGVGLPAIVGLTALDFTGGGKKKVAQKAASGLTNIVKKTTSKTVSQPTKSVLQTVPQLAGKVGAELPVKKSLDEVSSFYNLGRLNVSNKAKQAIQGEVDNAGKILEGTVGKRLTNVEVQKIADVTSGVLNKTVTRQQTAETIARNLKLRQEIAHVAESGKIDDNFVKLWVKDKAAGEDIARQLQARKISADPKTAGIIDIVLNAIYKQTQNADEVIKASKGVDFTDAKQVTELYRSFVKPKASEWIDLLRYNSMLTSPNTHIVNIVSNLQGTSLLTPIEKTVTGLIDATRSALTGSPRQYAIGEGAAYTKGYFTNLAKGVEDFTDVMRGRSLIVHPDAHHIPLATKGLKSVFEKTLNFPLRLLEGMDKFFSAMTVGGLENAQKYALSKGIKRTSDITEEAASRVFRGGTVKQGYVLNAVDSLTNLVMQARSSENVLLSTIAKFTLPFVRTPTEIFKQGIEYSPLGISTLAGAANKTEQLSKTIIGTASAAGAALLLGQDRLTWSPPSSEKQRGEFYAAGRQPYSIKMGDKWISYSKLHPAFAFNFALISAIDDQVKNQRLGESDADSILKAFGKWGNFIADQSYLKNIGDFVAGVKGDSGGITKLISNYPQQLVPFRALLSWVQRLTDPVQRQVDPKGTMLEKQMQQFMTQIPGLAQQVPERRGPLGNILKSENRLTNAFSPNRVTDVNKPYEALYQVERMKRKMINTRQDIRDKIKSEIERRMR